MPLDTRQWRAWPDLSASMVGRHHKPNNGMECWLPTNIENWGELYRAVEEL